jgi:1-deoxy-D-xylulose-5-phosphate reductoisomerase
MELIETKEFFGLPEGKIEAIIHPESLMHAIVGFNDGGMMAHLGPPDMRHSIGFALNYPKRKNINVARLDFKTIKKFTFLEADEVRYPALRLAREVMRRGGLWGSGFNAAKEVALDRFLTQEIGFLDMAKVVELTLDQLDKLGILNNQPKQLGDILNADDEARQISRAINV